jgi:glutamate racemase
VPLIENNKHFTEAGRMLIKEDVEKLLQKDDQIDTIILACTHYPILKEYIESIVPENVQIVSQGAIIAEKLQDYLERHPEIEQKCSKTGITRYLTTENEMVFSQNASLFLNQEIIAEHIKLN